MLGYIEYHEHSTEKSYLRQERRLGGTFLVLDMGQSSHGLFASNRAARAAKRMLDQGVRRAVFPMDFPHTAVFLRHGITPVDPLPLRIALSPLYVRRRLDALGLSGTQAVVAVVGNSMNGEIAQTVHELALAYRYVLLSVRSGGEEFAQKMRRQYGVSLLLAPSTDQLERADALVLFSPRHELSRENRVLCALHPGGDPRGCVPLQLDGKLLAAVDPNCPQDQLAAALHSMGVLPAEKLLGEITC